MTRFDRSYSLLIRIGLVVCIGFAAFARAAHDLWAACAVFGWLTFLALLLLLGNYRARRPSQLPCLGPAALVMVALATSALHSYDVSSSCLEVWIWFFCFVGFYLFVNTVTSPEHLAFFFALGSGVLVPLAVLCIADEIAGHPSGSGHWTVYGEVHATLINSIILSGFALYWFAFLWERKSRGGLNRVLLAAFAVVILLARSWGAYLSIGIGLAYYFKEAVIAKFHKRKLESILFVFAGMLACLLLGFLKFRHPGELHSAANRLSWWLAAFRMVVERPLTGVGLGAYGTAYPYFRTAGVLNTLYAHSFPLELLSETGLFGLISFSWLAGDLVGRIKRPNTESDDAPPTRRGLNTALLMAFSYGLISISLEYFLNKLLFFFTIGSLLAPGPKDVKVRPGLWSAGIAAFLIFLIPLWVAPLQSGRLLMTGLAHETEGRWATARACYLDAIRIDRTNGDAYAAAARTYRESFRQTRSASDLAQWRGFLVEAIHWKKDVRFVIALNHPPNS